MPPPRQRPSRLRRGKPFRPLRGTHHVRPERRCNGGCNGRAVNPRLGVDGWRANRTGTCPHPRRRAVVVSGYGGHVGSPGPEWDRRTLAAQPWKPGVHAPVGVAFRRTPGWIGDPHLLRHRQQPPLAVVEVALEVARLGEKLKRILPANGLPGAGGVWRLSDGVGRPRAAPWPGGRRTGVRFLGRNGAKRSVPHSRSTSDGTFARPGGLARCGGPRAAANRYGRG